MSDKSEDSPKPLTDGEKSEPHPPASGAESKSSGITTTIPEIEKERISKAFWLAIVGFVTTIGLAFMLALLSLAGFEDAEAVSGIVSPFLTVLGTLVGTFFGVQVGSAGKEQLSQQVQEANKQTQNANNKATAFAAITDPGKISEAITAYNSLKAGV